MKTRITALQNRFEKLIQDTINEYEQSFNIDFGHTVNNRARKGLEQRKLNEYRDSKAEMLFLINFTIYEAKQVILTNWLFQDEDIMSEYYERINDFTEKHPEYLNAFSSKKATLDWHRESAEIIKKAVDPGQSDFLPDDVPHFG
jgi:CHASE3 domain sensor protein